MRRVPSRRSLTSPAPCRTRRCCDTACLVTSKCAAILPAVISSSRTSRRISRRRGSTKASIAACTLSGRISALQGQPCASYYLRRWDGVDKLGPEYDCKLTLAQAYAYIISIEQETHEGSRE